MKVQDGVLEVLSITITLGQRDMMMLLLAMDVVLMNILRLHVMTFNE